MDTPARGGFIRPATVKAPVETKVQLATVGAGLSVATITPLALWLLGAALFGGSWSAFDVDQTLLVVPWPVTWAVSSAIVSAATFYAGYKGKHTARPDLDHGGVEPR